MSRTARVRTTPSLRPTVSEDEPFPVGFIVEGYTGRFVLRKHGTTVSKEI